MGDLQEKMLKFNSFLIFFPVSLPACGGMDNMCTVYDLNNRDATGAAKIVRELAGYEGFLSSCRFLDDKRLITGSGDMRMCGELSTPN